MLAVTCDNFPELMREYVEQIMQNFVLVIKRTKQLEEHALFSTTLNSMMDFVEQFSDVMGLALNELMPLFMEAINADNFDKLEGIENEGQKALN